MLAERTSSVEGVWRTPALRILATSREALGVSGETVCRVPSLSLPEALASVPVDALVDSDATQLFIDRARAVDPAFKPTPDNADAIARVCRRVDGIPLAIELAAARVVVLSPAQIETRLQDRFRLLTGGARTAVARQRTLEATVDWSYRLPTREAEHQTVARRTHGPAMDRRCHSRSREGFRRLKGHKDMPKLVAGLRARDQQLGIAVSVENVA